MGRSISFPLTPYNAMAFIGRRIRSALDSAGPTWRIGKMQISLDCAQIRKLAQEYEYPLSEDGLSRRLKKARTRGFMERDDLIEVAKWKWRGGRLRRLCEKNEDYEVKEVSALAFGTKSELLRIETLLALHGVSWPMASVILHFAFEDKYPIFDTRAMRAVGGSERYNLERWMEYAKLCKDKAERCGITMRELDKALWAYGKNKGR